MVSWMDFLLTARLRLRPLVATDADSLIRLYSDPEVTRYLGSSYSTADRVAEQLADFERHWVDHGYGQCAAIERGKGRFLGRVGLTLWPEWKEVELGYVLERAVWGRGLATEAARAVVDWAFANLEVEYVISAIQSENARSQAVAARLGMAVVRRDVTPATRTPVLVYSINRPLG
jgi:RimJ/RimL family protein N-acetyltransferase